MPIAAELILVNVMVCFSLAVKMTPTSNAGMMSTQITYSVVLYSNAISLLF